MPGTSAVSALAGANLAEETDRQRTLSDELWDALREAIPAMARNGHPTERLPNTLNVSFPGVRGSAVLAAAPEIAASTGSACHEGGEASSSVLLSMGISVDRALGAVRLSLGRGTTRAQVRRAARALIRAFREMRAVA